MPHPAFIFLGGGIINSHKNYPMILQALTTELQLGKLDQFLARLIDLSITAGKHILTAVLVYVVGRFLVNLINRLVRSMLERRHIDVGVQSFLRSMVNILLTVLLIISVIGALGVNTTSFAALLASAGVAVGMALSGNLQNFAGGIVILLFKPYRVGDTIEVQGLTGVVREVQIFHTILNTFDNKLIYIPNGSLSTSVVVNYSREGARRVQWTIGVDYGTDISRVQARDKAKLDAATLAGIQTIETIKASGAENGFFERWAGYQASVNAQKVKYAKINQYLGMIPSVVSTITRIVVLTLGVWFAMEGTFTVGMIMAFQGVLSSFSAPATTFISAGQTIQEMRTQMERVEDVMEYREDDCYKTEVKEESFAKLSGNIELKNITFGYSRLSEPVIRDFSLTVKPGQRVALVGTSGCGKSTISKLVSGLYQPWRGEILYDGKHLSEIDRDVFTGSLAVVDQEIALFEGTIAENIKMWDNSIEDFEMILAARDAQLHEEIMHRDGGYNYRIAEGGKDFSGGQRQRLEIARVLAQDPSIIILDEATSALDAKTEYDLVKAVKDRGITCIVVAHRLSTIRDCDEIIVLDHGVTVERGTHEELYAKGGKYTQLVSND